METHTADGWAGRHHLRTLKRAGFESIIVQPFAYALPHAFAAAAVLENAVAHARDAAAVSDGDATRWLADLQTAEERGEFLCVLTFFVATGLRPA